MIHYKIWSVTAKQRSCYILYSEKL